MICKSTICDLAQLFVPLIDTLRFQLALNRHQTYNGRVLSWYILEWEGRFIAQRTPERSKAGQLGLRPKVQLAPS